MVIKSLVNFLKNFFENRILIIGVITIIISLIFVSRLFNLQIVNGEYYRATSQKRVVRNVEIPATRGDIYDRNGVVLATSKLSYNVELYKMNLDADVLNDSIANLVRILYKNGDKIYSTFPVSEDLTKLEFLSDDEEKKFKEKIGIDENATLDDFINYYSKKYKLEKYENDKDLLLKIIMVKYEAILNGYSLLSSVTIAYDISNESLAQIEESADAIYGIEVAAKSKRYYPTGDLTSNVIGYVSKISEIEYDSKDKSEGYTLQSIIGKTGIEAYFEKYLRGKNGVKKVETDSYGNVTNEYETSKAESGNSITLTLDYRLQKVATESLVSTIKALNEGTLTQTPVTDANAGSVVVLDCNTGEVLSMVSYPSYDNNEFVNGISTKKWKELTQNALNPMYNRAISGTYSPGSTYKMLVGIAGLMSGGITVDEKYYDPGIYPYGYNPKCWIYSYYGITHGNINVSEAIKGSCNCFFYEVGRRIGISNIVKYALEFGLGQKTGVELPQESSGIIAGNTDKDWYLGDTLSAAIGQSYNQYTPIQLANYISTIANGGTLNKVSVIKDIKNEATNESVLRKEIDEYASSITGVSTTSKNLNIKQEYINAIKVGMLSVTTESGGTAASVFRGSEVQVAGKTGTSQVTKGTNNGIFVGFAPYDDPQIAVVAVIEHGEEGTYTANVVRPIMDEYFNIYKENRKNEKSQDATKTQINF